MKLSHKFGWLVAHQDIRDFCETWIVYEIFTINKTETIVWNTGNKFWEFEEWYDKLKVSFESLNLILNILGLHS